MPDTITTPSRRHLLAGLALAPLAALPGAAHAAEGSPGDAELLALHRQVLGATARMAAIAAEKCPAGANNDDRFTEALLAQHDAMLDLADAHATTLAGLKAKAEAIRMAFEVTFCGGHHPSIATIEEDAEWNVVLAWSLARDVLAMGGAGV